MIIVVKSGLKGLMQLSNPSSHDFVHMSMCINLKWYQPTSDQLLTNQITMT